MRKLKFLFITLLSVIILTASLVGCEGKKNDVPRVKGLFYKVEKDGNYLYLGGSVHVGKEVKFIDSVEKAYKESIGLGVEVDMQNSKVSETINKESMYPEGDNLLNHIKALTVGGDEYQIELFNNYPSIEEQQKLLLELYEAVINGDIPQIEKYTH